MSDLFDQVTGDMDIVKKLMSKIPGFSGYIERSNRRNADKILREFIANRYEEEYRRISGLQRELVANLELDFLDDIEAASIKVRQFIDRVRTATYGYSGFFDAVKVDEDRLASVYKHDEMLLDMGDELSRAVDNVETSIGTEGLPASIRHLTAVSQSVLDAYNKRAELLMGGGETPAVSQ